MVISPFEFATAQQIVFGAGARHRLVELVRGWGSRALWVTGSDPERSGAFREALADSGVSMESVAVHGEPTVEDVTAWVQLARRFRCDFLVAVGGGSCIDAAKAIAALAANDGEPLDYLEVIGRGRPLACAARPVVALPTTAGAGSEVTRNAVLKSNAQRVKVSVRHVSMLPRVALVDPELTLSLPPQVTADCGLDALTQVIEPFVSRAANPLTDGVCREGMRRAARSLVRAYRCGEDLEARSDMALASLCGGLALANAKLGAVHGFAGPLGGSFEAPHGALCARLLPEVLEANVQALRARGQAEDEDRLQRFVEVARIVTGNAHATVEEGVAWLRELGIALGVRPLSAYGMTEDAVDEIVGKAQRASSMRGNPIDLPPKTLAAILRAAL